MAEATVTALRVRDRRCERERSNLIVERKAAAMTVLEAISEFRRLYAEYAQARAQYYAALGAQPRSVSELAMLKMEHDRCDFRLKFALGVDIFGPRIHEARAHKWLTNDIKVLRAVGIVG